DHTRVSAQWRPEGLPRHGIPEAQHAASSQRPVGKESVPISGNDLATVGAERNGPDWRARTNELDKISPEEQDVEKATVEIRSWSNAMRRHHLQYRSFVASTTRTGEQRGSLSG